MALRIIAAAQELNVTRENGRTATILIRQFHSDDPLQACGLKCPCYWLKFLD